MSEKYGLRFIWTSPIVSESKEGKTYIEGVLVNSEGISRNNNEYTIESLLKIVKSAISKPLKFMRKFGSHYPFESEKYPTIGRIVKTWVSKGKVWFKALVTDNSVGETVKKNWGISVSGIALKFSVSAQKAGKVFLRIKDMMVNHIMLLKPFQPRGMESAQVTRVISESMTFVGMFQKLTTTELVAILYGSGVL